MFPFWYRLAWPPSLQGHCPSSSVLCSHPTACSSFTVLPCAVVQRYHVYIRPYGWYGNYRLSPVDAKALYDMADLRPHNADDTLTITLVPSCCLPVLENCRHIILPKDFGAVMPSDPAALLSTLNWTALPLPAQDSLSVVWLAPYWMGFPPINLCTLSRAHSSPFLNIIQPYQTTHILIQGYVTIPSITTVLHFLGCFKKNFVNWIWKFHPSKRQSGS